MKLSPHFTLAEACATSHPVKNEPKPDDIRRMHVLALHAEVIRAWWCPNYGMAITSGFRSAELNLRVNGAKESAHRYGCAWDLVPLEPGVTVEQIWRWLPYSGLQYDQAIWEIRPPDPTRGETEDVHWLHYGIERPGFGLPRKMHFIIDKR